MIEYALLTFGSLFAIVDPIAMNVVSRLMGLLLAAVGIQFILSAIHFPQT